ncbi:MAG: hypothetical protein ABL958_01205 [Bdellovibrionia bacterium]
MKSIVSVALIILFCLSSKFTHAAALNPDTEWKLLETAHFEVIYDARNHSIAAEYAAQAERAHTVLAPLFPVLPSGKTVIVIQDWTDMANGFATSFPRPQITIFPVLPTYLDSISHYDNWSQQIILHEYTHILTMEESNGWLAPLRFIFGSIVRPNALMPRWYLEGIAVELESRYTRFGRLRSPFYQAVTRALIKDGVWASDSIAQVNEAIPTWPYGMRPYFWGSLLLHEIGERKGPLEMVKLNSRYAGRVPFFINGPVEDLLGVDYADLLEQVRDKYDRGAKAQLEQIAKAGSPELQPLYSEQNLGLSPAISPDGKKLAFIATNIDGDSELRLLTRETVAVPFTGASKILTSGKRINKAAWFPDNKTLVYDSIASSGLYFEYSDLHILDTEANDDKKITENFRAQEPSVESKGKQIVFVQLTLGNTNISVIGRDGKGWKNIYQAPQQVRLSRPAFLSPNEVIFSEKLLSGKEYFRVINLTTKSSRTVLEGFEPAQAAQPTDSGLVFVSEKTGIANLYLANKNLTDARAITNSPTKILMGTLDAKNSDIYLSQLSSTGSQIYRQKLAMNALNPPVVSNAATSQWSEYKEPAEVTTAVDKEYRPLSYLWPQYWMPLFSLIPDGIYLMATTGSSDPLGMHGLSFDVTYDSLAEKGGGSAAYGRTIGATSYSVSAFYQPLYYYSLKLSTTTYGANFVASFPLSTNSTKWRGSARYGHLSQEFSGPATCATNSVSPTCVRSGPALGVRFDNTSQKNSMISPESGGYAFLEHQQFLAGVGNSDYGSTRFSGAYYFSKWLPVRNAVMFRANAVTSPANRTILLGNSGGGDYSFTFIDPQFVVRGYPVGNFLGYSLVTATVEYRFPIGNVYGGWDTRPIFLRRWHGALFSDAVAVDGAYYNKTLKALVGSKLGNIFYSAGAEFRSDITLAYHVPATFRVGLFYGLNEEAYGGFTPFIGLTIPKF